MKLRYQIKRKVLFRPNETQTKTLYSIELTDIMTGDVLAMSVTNSPVPNKILRDTQATLNSRYHLDDWGIK